MHKRTSGIILFFTAAALTVLLVWNLIQKEKTQLSDVWTEEFSHLKADLTLEEVKYSRITPAGRRWTVHAERARLYEDSNRMVLDNLTITFFRGKNRKIVVDSDTGSYDREKNLLSVEKNVIVKFENGVRLYAEILHYDQQEHIIWSDRPVILKRDDGLVIKGKNMEYQMRKGLIILRDQESIIPASDFDQV